MVMLTGPTPDPVRARTLGAGQHNHEVDIPSPDHFSRPAASDANYTLVCEEPRNLLMKTAGNTVGETVLLGRADYAHEPTEPGGAVIAPALRHGHEAGRFVRLDMTWIATYTL